MDFSRAVDAKIISSFARSDGVRDSNGVWTTTEAQKILAYRQQHGGFRSVDDLGEVSGIGPKKLAALRGKVQP